MRTDIGKPTRPMIGPENSEHSGASSMIEVLSTLSRISAPNLRLRIDVSDGKAFRLRDVAGNLMNLEELVREHGRADRVNAHWVITDHQARRMANLIKRQLGLRYYQALDIVAMELGFRNWSEAQPVIAAGDLSERYRRRLAQKERTKVKARDRAARAFLRRLQAGKARTESTEREALGWRGWLSASYRIRYSIKPADRVAACVVFRARSDS